MRGRPHDDGPRDDGPRARIVDRYSVEAMVKRSEAVLRAVVAARAADAVAREFA